MSLRVIAGIVERAHTGPVCSAKEWDTRRVYGKASEKLKEHGLQGTCRPEEPINTDDSLADGFFKAGFELALDIGMLCVDTERVIKIDEQELRETIRNKPSDLVVGTGSDARILTSRSPGDKRLPLKCAPVGIAVSEDIWIPLMRRIVENREIDLFQGGSLISVFGLPIRSGTPYETLAGKVEAQMHRTALELAGRPGMCTTAVISSVTDLGHLSGYGSIGGYQPTDLALILSPAELKTNYASLNKVVHTLGCGGRIIAGCASMIGGFAGGVEATALVRLADSLLRLVVHQSTVAGAQLMDVGYNGNCGREGMWAMSVVIQALSRSTQLITNAAINQVAGPETEMLLYESAVGMMNYSVSGLSIAFGPRSAGGKYTDYLTPLEAKFSGEVLKSCAGLKPGYANEVAKKLIPKYEKFLSNPPKGKSVRECYDLNANKPSEEWGLIYRRIRKELVDLGVPMVN